MTSRPLVLPPATPCELLSYIISSQKYPTTLIVGCSKQEFLSAVVEEVIYQLSLDNQLEAPATDNPEHPLLKTSLYQIAISRHIRIVFIPSVTHLRSYLSVFSAKDSPVSPPPNYTPRAERPLLLVYGLLSLHRDASEWSAQGVGNSVAVLVDCAAKNGFRPAALEPRGSGGHEDLDQIGDEIIPLLNGTTKKSDGSWGGRTASVRQVLTRWFAFETQEWAIR